MRQRIIMDLVWKSDLERIAYGEGAADDDLDRSLSLLLSACIRVHLLAFV
jgi:hypothetical protein